MSVALSLSDRQLLVASAPEGLGDHVVSFKEGTVFAIVRKDTTTPTGRVVALARSPEELARKVAPPATDPAAAKSAGSPGTGSSAQAARPTDAQQRAAQSEMRSELAEYRRACAAAGVAAPKLI